MVSINPEADIFSPNKLFSCDVAMMTEVAEVKPTVTGIDMKSIRRPSVKRNN